MHVKALLRISITVSCCAIIAAAAPGAIAAPTLQTAPLIQLSTNAKYGPILVNAQGMTLYELSSETFGKFACNAGCLAVWPPVTVPAGATAPSAVSGVIGTLGVVTRADGTLQATDNGWPLYTFAHDSAPGDTKGQGIVAFGGVWHVVQNTLIPLSATPVERLAIHITTTGGTVWGHVTVRYNQGTHTVQQTCARASCLLHVPYGATVRLIQSPTSATTWPFKVWQIRSVPGPSRSTGNGTRMTLQMLGGYAVKAVYTLR